MNQRNKRINIYTKLILKLNSCLMLSAWICCYAHIERNRIRSHVTTTMFYPEWIRRMYGCSLAPTCRDFGIDALTAASWCAVKCHLLCPALREHGALSMFPVEWGDPCCHGRVPPDDKQVSCSWIEFNVCSCPKAGQINTGLQLQGLTFRQTASFQATQWPFLFRGIALLGVIVYTVSTLIPRDT